MTNVKNAEKGTLDAKATAVTPIKKNTMKDITIAFVIGVLLIVGGYFGYKHFVSDPAEDKGQTQLTEAMDRIQMFEQANMQLAQMKATPDSILAQDLINQGIISSDVPADSLMIVTKQKRADMVNAANGIIDQLFKGDGKFPGLLKIAANGGKAGNTANYLTGVCYFKMGKYKEAIKYLEAFSPQDDHSISAIALQALGHAYATDGQIDKAIETFKDAAEQADNEKDNPLTPACLIEAAKLLESQGKKAEAHEIYVNVKKDFPQFGNQQGMNTSEVDRYIERTK